MTSDATQTHGTGTPSAPGGGVPSSRVTRMGTESIPKLITEFAIPSVVGMVVNGSYNLIDSMFLGHAMGELGLSAVTVANPTMIVFMALAMLVGTGGNALAALRLGEGNRDAAERALGNVITMSLVLWVLVALLAANPAVIDAVLTLSSATDDVRPYARTFIQILCYGFILQCIGMGVNNFIRTAGAPNRALGTMVIGLVAATGFNYLFVILLGWGVAGSALATLAGQACSCAAVLWYFLFTKNVPLRIRLSCLRPARRIVTTILAFGFPGFALQAGAALVNFLLNYQLVKYGALSPLGAEDALASIGVVQRIGMFTIMPIVGVSVAIQPLLGYNYGARKIDRVRTTLWLSIAGATVICLVEWAVTMLFAEPIVAAFGVSHDGLVEFTAFALRMWLLMLPFIGFQIVGSNYFQATGQPAKAIFLTLTRQIIFLVPLVLFLPSALPALAPSLTGLDALYVAAPVSDFLAIFTVGIFLVWEMRRLRRVQATGGPQPAGKPAA
ncbi:MATE family efflux transporter [Adlercreutzia faecimuris]|uniref:Multidrug export protein MepA n=1 Tax=Adlercreutzia faecimuris TaxID=2897341 RepID=A0ABS9WEH3_9ACTN|nr:MATE family efflux transporter [Adlercreutzia sp. JBNU-10]MCI2241263.1 MATE family efflux transporter [Adlercreutzia sp. JBNU-10]